MNGRKLMLLLIAVLALVAAGCGGDSKSEATPATVETTVETDTAATETNRAEDTTATDSTATTGVDTSALTGKCAELAQLGAKLSQSMSGQSGSLDDVSKVFDELAGQVPDEIKADYEVLAKNFKTIAEALKGVDLQSGQAPSPDQAAKLQQALASIDNAEVQAATKRIEAWAAKNC
jgi:uncharacterized protein YydD (DUF2326 family)